MNLEKIEFNIKYGELFSYLKKGNRIVSNYNRNASQTNYYKFYDFKMKLLNQYAQLFIDIINNCTIQTRKNVITINKILYTHNVIYKVERFSTNISTGITNVATVSIDDFLMDIILNKKTKFLPKNV